MNAPPPRAAIPSIPCIPPAGFTGGGSLRRHCLRPSLQRPPGTHHGPIFRDHRTFRHGSHPASRNRAGRHEHSPLDLFHARLLLLRPPHAHWTHSARAHTAKVAQLGGVLRESGRPAWRSICRLPADCSCGSLWMGVSNVGFRGLWCSRGGKFPASLEHGSS